MLLMSIRRPNNGHPLCEAAPQSVHFQHLSDMSVSASSNRTWSKLFAKRANSISALDLLFTPSTNPRLCVRLRVSHTLVTCVLAGLTGSSIDGVLLRSAMPLPHARRTLKYLQSKGIPFILLTNGGGKHESERIEDLSRQLAIPLDTSMFVQSHTPFAGLVDGNGQQEGLKDKCVLILGGEGDKCREVAQRSVST